MRITTGSLGGRSVAAPKTTATRPMADKVRAALFNIIGDVKGMIVLDAYAGSGAVGFEALSRGAARVVAVESGRVAIQAINASAAKLSVGQQYKLSSTTTQGWLKRQSVVPAFNLIIADPPYENLQPDELEQLGSLLQADGILVVSHSSRLNAPKLASLTRSATKTYGDTALSFYKPT